MQRYHLRGSSARRSHLPRNTAWETGCVLSTFALEDMASMALALAYFLTGSLKTQKSRNVD